MSEIVKTITIGTDVRDIGAKYDNEGNSFKDVYLKQGDASAIYVSITNAENPTTGFIKKNEASNYISDGLIQTELNNLVTSGSLKVPQNKRIYFKAASTNQEIKNESEEEDKRQLLKAIVYYVDTEAINDKLLGEAILSSSYSINTLGHAYFLPGASFEIYKNVLICTNSFGDKTILAHEQPELEGAWTSLKLNFPASFALLVYEEGWEELNNTETPKTPTEGEE